MALACRTSALKGSNNEKNGCPKSFDTLPLMLSQRLGICYDYFFKYLKTGSSNTTNRDLSSGCAPFHVFILTTCKN
jgi:hypothetical protein